MIFRHLVLLAALVAALLFLAPVLADRARADEAVPRGLGHPNDGSHWYDNACCNMMDCEQVEEGAITRSATGYVIRYRTSRGFVASGFLRFGDKGIRHSRDGFEHGCATTQRVLCIYLPPET